MDATVNFFTALIRAVFEFLHLGYSMTQPPAKSPELRAEFESDQKLFSIYHEGFCIDGKRSMSLKDSFRHAVIVGKSGIGKSTSTFISSLLTMHTSDCSMVVHDPSKELFEVCSGHLKQQGYRVLVLDFSDPRRSVGFNPLDSENIKQSSDIDRYASMLVNTSMQQKDPFWEKSTEQLIKTVALLSMRLPSQYRNSANVLHLIKLMDADPKRMDALIAHYADDKLFIDYKAFIAKDVKVRSGIIATACAALSIFSDENVATVTSKSTFSFSSLRKRKTVLFIQNKIADQQYLNVLISIWFEQFFASILSSIPKPNERSIYMLLDEAASGLRMPSFSNSIAHFRKYRVGCLIGLQSVEQLKQTYNDNDAGTIMGNCFVQMYFSEQSHNTAKMLEEMLGRYTYEDNNSVHQRNLMEANEIRMLGKGKAIIIAGGEKPILAELTPFYDRWWLKLRANLKPPVMVGVGSISEIEYIK